MAQADFSGSGGTTSSGLWPQAITNPAKCIPGSFSVHQGEEGRSLAFAQPSTGFTKTGVKDSCDPPCGCLELAQGPWQERRAIPQAHRKQWFEFQPSGKLVVPVVRVGRDQRAHSPCSPSLPWFLPRLWWSFMQVEERGAIGSDLSLV